MFYLNKIYFMNFIHSVITTVFIFYDTYNAYNLFLINENDYDYKA